MEVREIILDIIRLGGFMFGAYLLGYSHALVKMSEYTLRNK